MCVLKMCILVATLQAAGHHVVNARSGSSTVNMLLLCELASVVYNFCFNVSASKSVKDLLLALC